MRIAIDARLNAYRRGGIPQYTRNLLEALAEVDRENQYISLQHRQMLRPLAVASNVRRHVIHTPPHNRFEPWSLPLELLPVRPNLLHCPDFIAPVRRSFPVVVTIHDLAFMQYPEILDADARQYYGKLTHSTARAEGIIAVSESTRQDIAQYLDVPIQHIDVVYEAAAPQFRPVELREGEARVLNGEPVAADTFMLFVSTLEPRKNLPTLLKALRIAIDRRPDRPYKLVVVGGRGWKDQPIFDAARDLNLGDHVLFAGNVGIYDLRWLYNACRFYINPSLYEGFGLPLLEAMACGAACLASATSSLPEIGGDAAIYVPPLDAGLWADAIEQLWDDLDRQHELGRLGYARSQRFSWQRAARETLKVYERVVEGVPRQPTSLDEPARELVPQIQSGRRAATEVSRACLRCGAQLVPGDLQHDLTIRRSDDMTEYNVLASRAWVCPNCGQVELVSEWRALAPDQQPPADGKATIEPGDAVVLASNNVEPANNTQATISTDEEHELEMVEHANEPREAIPDQVLEMQPVDLVDASEKAREMETLEPAQHADEAAVVDGFAQQQANLEEAPIFEQDQTVERESEAAEEVMAVQAVGVSAHEDGHFANGEERLDLPEQPMSKASSNGMFAEDGASSSRSSTRRSRRRR